MKKYYRNRYASLLKTLADQNKKKENDLEEFKKAEEKKKNKLKEDLGINKVQSRFMEEQKYISKEIWEAKERAEEEVVKKGRGGPGLYRG